MAHPNDTKLSPEQHKHMQILRQAEKGIEAMLQLKSTRGAKRTVHELSLEAVREQITAIRKAAGLD